MTELLSSVIPPFVWVCGLLILIFKFPNLFQVFVSGIKRLSVTSEGVEIERAVATASEVISNKEGIDKSNTVNQILTRLPAGKKILWVDDHPEGNTMEAEAFEAAGITVILATSNKEAIIKFKGTEFDLIISDIARDDHESGIDLPKIICEDRNRVPPIIYYTGQVNNQRTPDGYPVVNKPSELFQLTGDILRLRK